MATATSSPLDGENDSVPSAPCPAAVGTSATRCASGWDWICTAVTAASLRIATSFSLAAVLARSAEPPAR